MDSRHFFSITSESNWDTNDEPKDLEIYLVHGGSCDPRRGRLLGYSAFQDRHD